MITWLDDELTAHCCCTSNVFGKRMLLPLGMSERGKEKFDLGLTFYVLFLEQALDCYTLQKDPDSELEATIRVFLRSRCERQTGSRLAV